MKKIKKPLHNLALEVYEKQVIEPTEYDRIDYRIFREKELINKEDYRIIFDVCKFENSTIINNSLERSEFLDCIFMNCDLSNNSFSESTFLRCEFIDCKLTGSHFTECYIDNVLIKGSMADFLDVSSTKVNLLSIKDTSLKESNWFENKIKGMEFINNNFSKSMFYETSLKGISMATCNISELTIDLFSLKGLEIAGFQAENFCNLLGIKVV